MTEPKRRTWSYVQRPEHFEVAGCELCGNTDPDWSEWAHQLWCQNCQIDFIPAHNGIFDGPIPVECAHMLGISFDTFDIATGKVTSWREELAADRAARGAPTAEEPAV